MSADPRLPVVLCQNGARSISQGLPDVRITVDHEARDSTQSILPGLTAAAAAWDEMLVFSAFGVTSRVSTALVREASASHADPGGLQPPGVRLESPHNPSFLYEAGRSLEMLVTLDSSRAPLSVGASLAMLEACELLSRAAGEVAESPILFMQAPVAPQNDPSGRYRGDGSGERPRTSQASAIRMAISLDDASPAKRIAAVRRVMAECELHGYGLQINDRRSGRVRGDWWSLLRPDPDTVAAHSASLALDVASRAKHVATDTWNRDFTEVVVVTAVGPARTGSTLAILADLMARNMSIVGLSVAALQEVAVITAYLGVGAAVEGGDYRQEIGDLRSVLGIAASRSALTHWQGRMSRKSQLTRALDYQMVMSGPFPAVPAEPSSVPLWIAWSSGLAASLTASPAEMIAGYLKDDPIVSFAEVSYARARHTDGSGRIRGRAKISIAFESSLPREGLATWLGEKADECERFVRRSPEFSGTQLEVRVAWRERWLGSVSDAPL